MIELFDYGGAKPTPSPEVIRHGIEEDLLHTDWRQRASDQFRKIEDGKLSHDFGSAIGALSLALMSEKTIRSRSAEIKHWEARLQLEHSGPND